VAEATPPPCSEATSRKGLAPLGGPFWAKPGRSLPVGSAAAPPALPETTPVAIRSLVKSGSGEDTMKIWGGDKILGRLFARRAHSATCLTS
jgi:hypothetical protein